MAQWSFPGLDSIHPNGFEGTFDPTFIQTHPASYMPPFPEEYDNEIPAEIQMRQPRMQHPRRPRGGSRLIGSPYGTSFDRRNDRHQLHRSSAQLTPRADDNDQLEALAKDLADLRRESGHMRHALETNTSTIDMTVRKIELMMKENKGFMDKLFELLRNMADSCKPGPVKARNDAEYQQFFDP